MKIQAKNPDEYIELLPEDQKIVVQDLVKVISENLPEGFQKTMSYGMIGFVVPHSIYPQGYHCDAKLPLPFISVAAQKNSVSLYHMGLYADPELMLWFLAAFAAQSKSKPDVGKSCIRFKQKAQIPYALIGQLCERMSPKDWIAMYERVFVRDKR